MNVPRSYLVLLLLSCYQLGHAQEVLYATRLGSGSMSGVTEQEISITHDEVNNYYVTGGMGSGIIFGEGQPNQTTLNVNGSFLAKYNENHEFLWVEQISSSNNSVVGYDLAYDINGFVYVTGKFYMKTTFGIGQSNETTLEGAYGEMFLAKYDTNGSLIWAISEGGEYDDGGGHGVEVDSDGNVYVTGSFKDTVTFGKGDEAETTLTGSSWDIFLAKYNANGNLLWVRSAGGPSGDTGRNVFLDNQGNIILSGSYFDIATFDKDGSNEVTLSDYNISGFIAKYDKDGNFLWAIEPLESDTGDYMGEVKSNNDGDIFYAGAFWQTVVFGRGTANEISITGNGQEDILLAKYNADGKFMWVKTAGTGADDRGVALEIDDYSNIYLTGYFGDDITFGSNESGLISLQNTGLSDMFLTKYSSEGELIWATSAVGDQWDQGSQVCLDRNGKVFLAGFYRSELTLGLNEPNQTQLAIRGYSDLFISTFSNTPLHFNYPPEITSPLFIQAIEDEPFVYYATATDVDSDELTFSISNHPEWLSISNSEVSGTPTEGVLEATFDLIVNDGNEGLSTETVTISVIPINDAPQINEYVGPLVIALNESIQLQLAYFTVFDPDNSFPDDFTLVALEGENYELMEDKITPYPDYTGTLDVSVMVNDGELNSSVYVFTIEVSCEAKNLTGLISMPNEEALSRGMIKLFDLDGGLYSKTDVIDGTYSFSDIHCGQYYLQVVPLGSASSDVFPTYYEAAKLFPDADILTIENDEIVNMTMIGKSAHPVGNGLIEGKIEESKGARARLVANTSSQGSGIPFLGVYLLLDSEFFTGTLTDENGYFKFENIPNGTYEILFDMPGLDMSLTKLAVNLNGTMQISTTVDPDLATPLNHVIEEVLSSPATESTFIVYPNPVSNSLFIKSNEQDHAPWNIQLQDVSGRALNLPFQYTAQGILVDVSLLQPGIYFVKISEGPAPRIYKFVKVH